MNNRILMVAPTGARRTKADHPQLPITPAEIADCAAACQDAGANAFHLHVRDDDQSHSLSPDRYRAAISAIRARCPDLPIQCTTESAGIFDVDAQIAMVKNLRPDWVSYSLAEMLRDGEDKALDFLRWCDEAKITVQFILYSPEDIATFSALKRRGALAPTPQHIILVAGRYGAEDRSSLSYFDALYAALAEESLDKSTSWMTCAFGVDELACLQRSFELGGHARVGFENAITDATGRVATDNAERVSELHAIAAQLGCPIAKVAEVEAALR